MRVSCADKVGVWIGFSVSIVVVCVFESTLMIYIYFLSSHAHAVCPFYLYKPIPRHTFVASSFHCSLVRRPSLRSLNLTSVSSAPNDAITKTCPALPHFSVTHTTLCFHQNGSLHRVMPVSSPQKVQTTSTMPACLPKRYGIFKQRPYSLSIRRILDIEHRCFCWKRADLPHMSATKHITHKCMRARGRYIGHLSFGVSLRV